MPFIRLRAAAVAVCCAIMLLATQPAEAGSVTKNGFVFPADTTVKVVVFRPDVHVGSLKVGGVDEPNADWTAAARKNIQAAMESSPEAQRAQMVFLGEYEGADGELVNQYRGLFEAAAGAMFQHEMLGDRLPTKLNPLGPAVPDKKPKKTYRLDWTLGPDAAKLKTVTGGDYALFFFTHDAYGDAGRKVAQLLMAGLFGAYVPAGIHTGYAALVDLSTGEIIWFNTDLAMGGDPREVDGAKKRVSQLLEGFPARGAAPAAAPAAQ